MLEAARPRAAESGFRQDVYCSADEAENYWSSSCARSIVCTHHSGIGVTQKPVRNNKRSPAGRI